MTRQPIPPKRMKVICMILKAPRVGTVKTRLAREIGAERATLIYRDMVEHQVRAILPGWNVSVHFCPADAGEEMEAWLKPSLPASTRFAPQCDGDWDDALGQSSVPSFRMVLSVSSSSAATALESVTSTLPKRTRI